MPWGNISLNDGEFPLHLKLVFVNPNLFYAGTSIPSIAFGTWKMGNGQGPIDQVEQALSVGFTHIGVLILSCSVGSNLMEFLKQFPI